MPGKISTLCRKVCQTSGPDVLPNGTLGSGWSRVLTWPVCGTAGQLSAMNSCHAKTPASCNEADAAPPLISGGGNQGLFAGSMFRVTALQLPGVTARSSRGATGGLLLRWHEAPSNNVRDNNASANITRILFRDLFLAAGEFSFVFIFAFFPSHGRNTSVNVVSIWWR